MRGLIVDDEEAIRRLLARLLGRSGWSVDTAADGRQALDAFAPGRFRLAFIDIDFGGGADGIALAAQLRRLDVGLRIVMMSGRPENAARVEAAGLGPMLQKPFDLSRVQSFIAA